MAQAARTCEAACRRLAAATMGITHLYTENPKPTVERCANAILDCSFVAAATARLISRVDRQPIETLIHQVEVCRRTAAICVDVCELPAGSSVLLSCADLSRDCVRSCDVLLRALRNRVPVTADPIARGGSAD